MSPKFDRGLLDSQLRSLLVSSIVDRSLEPHDNKVVIAIVDDQLTVKRFKKLKNQQLVDKEQPTPLN